MFTVNDLFVLLDFVKYANEETFRDVWGENIGSHLWHEKLHDKYDGDFMKLLQSLDRLNCHKLAAHLNVTKKARFKD